AKINDVFSAILDRKRHQYVDRAASQLETSIKNYLDRKRDQSVDRAASQLDSAIKNHLERKRMMYDERDRTLKSLYPTHHFDQVGKDLTICREQLNKAMEGFIGARIRYADDMRKALDQSMDHVIRTDGAKLAEASAALDALSPLKTLQRGYSIVYLGDRAVRSSSELTLGDRLDIKFADGQAKVRVEEIE
ncbi:MAG: hypothetical protein IKR73_01060, partial [Oscillospiraceae bacterium]|nr:hypothetical protein [Oscillospiraceae bacterium]